MVLLVLLHRKVLLLLLVVLSLTIPGPEEAAGRTVEVQEPLLPEQQARWRAPFWN